MENEQQKFEEIKADANIRQLRETLDKVTAERDSVLVREDALNTEIGILRAELKHSVEMLSSREAQCNDLLGQVAILEKQLEVTLGEHGAALKAVAWLKMVSETRQKKI